MSNKTTKIGNSKKSQITIFIIVGFFVVITVLLISYIQRYAIKEKISEDITEAFKKDVGIIKNYIETCVRDTGYNGLVLLGKQGGYADIPASLRIGNTSYWYYEAVNIQPLFKEIEDRYSNYLDNNLHKCFDLILFEKRGFNITAGITNAEITFGIRDISVRTEFNLIIKKGSLESKKADFFNIYPIRFREMYFISTGINNKLVRGIDIPDVINNITEVNASYQRYNNSFIITLKENAGSGFDKGFALEFGIKPGISSIPISLPLQNNSASVPTIENVSISSIDDALKLEIPQGATISKGGEDISEIKLRTFLITTQTEVPLLGILEPASNIYKLEPNGTRFSKPSKLTLEYDPSLGIGEPKIFYYDGFRWIHLGGNVDREKHTVTAEITHFSYYVIYILNDKTYIDGDGNVVVGSGQCGDLKAKAAACASAHAFTIMMEKIKETLRKSIFTRKAARKIQYATIVPGVDCSKAKREFEQRCKLSSGDIGQPRLHGIIVLG